MRIISGKHKGRNLLAPKTTDVRPTLDVVKQAFFTKLQFEIDGASFLDLFGGSGAMGIEALSRGADVTICDNNPESIDLIRHNLKLIGEKCDVQLIDYKKFLKTNKKQFDIIYLDPPYEHKKAYESALKLIKENTQLSPNGIVVCEHYFETKLDYSDYQVDCQKKYGTVVLTYLRPSQQN